MTESTEGVKRDALLALEDNEKLSRFAAKVMGEWPENAGLDGGDIQDIATASGLLIETTMQEPCGETSDECACLEYCGRDEWPLQCFRVSDTLKRARALLRSLTKGAGE